MYSNLQKLQKLQNLQNLWNPSMIDSFSSMHRIAFHQRLKDIENCRKFLQPYQTLDMQTAILEHFRRGDDHAQMSEIGYKKKTIQIRNQIA
jgi:hypothetical protein